MSEESTSRTVGQTLKMSDVSCKNLEYTIVVPLDKFDFDSFKTGIGAKPEAKYESRVCNTRDRDEADYHVHFRWRLLKKRNAIEFELDYVASPQNPRPGEVEPFAENVMPWLGKYFKFSDANSMVVGNFLFRKDKRQVVFPIPIKTQIAELGWEAEINGVMCDLPTKPDGIARVFVTQADDLLLIGVNAARSVEFATFSVSKELEWATDMTSKLVR